MINHGNTFFHKYSLKAKNITAVKYITRSFLVYRDVSRERVDLCYVSFIITLWSE